MQVALRTFFCVAALLLSGGCHTTTESAPSNVNVVVEGPGTLPPALAGRWQADRDGWEFAFAPDGHIVSAVLSLGRVEISPGQPVTLATRGGGKGLFEPGEWTVHYIPETNQLTLKVVMDHVRIDMAGTVLEGATTDTFSGAISPDDGVWQVQWTAFNRYTIQAPGQPARALSTDEIYGETKALTFEKVPEK